MRVKLPERYKIEKVFEILESNYSNYQIPEKQLVNEIKSQLKIFIGHGRNKQWRDLKDHLQDKHNFEVISYETGARAGYTITEVLEEMSSRASFALLVLTAEDSGIDGNIRARENVIHEVGLFQGRLGFKKGIIVLEDGCNEFTNISGIQQIRFKKGSIKETYGDILATIYREFGITFNPPLARASRS
ncbi:MAG: nucleotide-binding protein [Flavobacterium sp.]|nr:nucleotide-binding protein [Flavobacterium sp.]